MTDSEKIRSWSTGPKRRKGSTTTRLSLVDFQNMQRCLWLKENAGGWGLKITLDPHRCLSILTTLKFAFHIAETPHTNWRKWPGSVRCGSQQQHPSLRVPKDNCQTGALQEPPAPQTLPGSDNAIQPRPQGEKPTLHAATVSSYVLLKPGTTLEGKVANLLALGIEQEGAHRWRGRRAGVGQLVGGATVGIPAVRKREVEGAD